jgi:pseudouridine-5'-phosphate glycosidase
MPYPQNYETALQLEEIVRFEGAVPATIAILDGKIHIGSIHISFTFLHFQRPSTNRTRNLSKTRTFRNQDISSRSRLRFIYQKTWCYHVRTFQEFSHLFSVSTTALLAHMVGIKVFVTGGIGGVHRHGESSISHSHFFLTF